MATWICPECGQEVLAEEKPSFKWSDGHTCNFVEESTLRNRPKVDSFEVWLEKVDEELGRAVALSSEDLPDWNYRSAYDNGFTPKEVATQILLEGGL